MNESPKGRPSKDLLAEWNEKLGKDLPEELESIPQEEVEHTDVYNSAMADLENYFLTTDRNVTTAHLKKAKEVLDMMKSSGASAAEIEDIEKGMDDFVRDVEDTVTDLRHDAEHIAQKLIAHDPGLEAQMVKFANFIMLQLKKSSYDVQPETLRAAADLAIEAVTDPHQSKRILGTKPPEDN